MGAAEWRTQEASQQWSGAESLTKRMNSSQIAGITWAESCFSRASTASGWG